MYNHYLSDIEPKTWHLLPVEEQWMILRNTAMKADGGRLDELSLEDIKRDECIDVYVLCQAEYSGPFASTVFEGRYSWGNYIYEYAVGQVDYARFIRASEKNYWHKYIGLTDYNPHSMGEMMHAVALLGEVWFPEVKLSNTAMSPANCIPAYTKALKGFEGKNALFIGAFSAKSVSDIWLIKNYVLNNECNVSIIELSGHTSRAMADHYRLPFTTGDGLDMEIADSSIDLIMTNSLGTHLQLEYDPAAIIGKRKKLFCEMVRVLKPGGRIALCEHPIRDEEVAEFASDEHIKLDTAIIKRQLTDLGFKHISIESALKFKGRRSLESYIQSRGKLKLSDVDNIQSGTNTMLLISAIKSQ